MKRVEVCFNFCPNCGRDMRATKLKQEVNDESAEEEQG